MAVVDLVPSNLWAKIEGVVEAQGLTLFDIDEPKGSADGVLRVYISDPNRSGKGVGFEDCTRVCKILLDLDEQESFVPDGCSLEVSSPGVNRRLRWPSHFQGAIG